MSQSEPQEMYTVEQAALYLKISTKTLRRYLDASLIEFCVLNPLAERRHIRIERRSLEAFIRRNSHSLPTPERPKRVYHRAYKKYARKKKPGKKKAA